MPTEAGATQPTPVCAATKWIVLIAVAVAVRTPRLLDSLWYDELWATRVVLPTFGDLLYQALVDVHPPLYNTLMFVWIRVFGQSEIAVRMPAFLAGLGTIALMPRLGSALATQNAGWIAAGLLALSPVHIWYSDEARAYAAVMFCCVLLVVIDDALDRPAADRWSKAGFVLLAAAAPMMHYYAIVVIGMLALMSRRHRSRGTIVVGAVVAASGLGLYVAMRVATSSFRTEASYLRSFTLPTMKDLYVDWFLLGGVRTTGIAFGVVSVYAIVSVGLVALATWRVTRAGRPFARWRLLGLMLSVPSMLLLLGFVGRTAYFIERSALPVLPFFLVAIGAGLLVVPRPIGRRVAAAILCVGSITVLGIFFLQRDQWTVYKPNPDWRTISSSLSTESGSTRGFVVIGIVPPDELLYYRPGGGKCPWPPRDTRMDFESFRRKLRLATAPRKQPSCGTNGEARDRLYFVQGGADDVRRILAFEGARNALFVHNEFWGARWSRALLEELRSTAEFRVARLASARGLQVWKVSRD